MKSINNYINEHLIKGHTRKQTIRQWKWRGKALSNDEFNEYRNTIARWAKQKYGEFTPDVYIGIIKKYYRQFVIADTNVKSKLEQANKNADKMINYAERMLPQKGISWFDNNYMGQGWFDYMNYMITNNYI